MRGMGLTAVVSASRAECGGVDIFQVQNAAVAGHQDHGVALLQTGGAFRNDDLAAADDDRDENAPAQPQVPEGDAQIAGGVVGLELHGLCLTVRNAVQRGHHGPFGILHAPDQPENLVGGGQLGRDHRLHPGRAGDGGVILPVGLGNHLGDAALVGVEGDDQVVLVPVGEGHEGVAGRHVLFHQQLRVRAVAVDDQTAGHLLRQLPAPVLALLHHLAAHAEPLQDAQQVVGDPAAAKDEDGAQLVLVPAQQLEKLIDAGGGAGQVDLVPLLQHKGSVRDIDLAGPLHRAQQQREVLQFGGEGGQGPAGHKVRLLDVEGDDLHLPPGEGVDVGCAGEAQQTGDLHRSGLLRIDQQINAQVRFQIFQVSGVFGAAHPGHGAAHAQPVGAMTAQQVIFIGIGGGDDHVRIPGARLQQDRPGGAVALDAHDVYLVGGPV